MNRSNDAKNRAMDDHRPVLVIVLANVNQVEALGRGVVELNRAQLPGAANRIRYVEIDLGTIERAIARVLLKGQTERHEGCP